MTSSVDILWRLPNFPATKQSPGPAATRRLKRIRQRPKKLAIPVA